MSNTDLEAFDNKIAEILTRADDLSLEELQELRELQAEAHGGDPFGQTPRKPAPTAEERFARDAATFKPTPAGQRPVGARAWGGGVTTIMDGPIEDAATKQRRDQIAAAMGIER